MLGLVTAGILGLFTLARMLEPSPTGVGTHTQLGLPPCATLAVFDSRCPACGMTTSWSLVLHFRFIEAMEANVGGSLLAIIAMVSLPITCYFSITGGVYYGEELTFSLAIAIAISLVLAVLQWAVRIDQ